MKTDYNDVKKAVADYLQGIGVTYTAVFVPQSASRNSTEKQPTLNWRVTLMPLTGKPMATDYSQGIGHVPGLKLFVHKTLHDESQIKAAAERGINPNTGKRLQPPHVADVIHSLLLDSGVNDAAGFEDWASEYGYDTDSRKAGEIYNACKLIARDFCRVLTAAQRAHLADLLQDY